MKIQFWACVLLALFVTSVAAEEIDPTITPSKTLTCTLPVERTDGTPLAVDEIAQVRFYVSQDGSTWTQNGTNTVCLQVYDLTNVADGQYYYTADVVDTEGRESEKSPQVADLLVKRIAPPASPSGVGWQ